MQMPRSGCEASMQRYETRLGQATLARVINLPDEVIVSAADSGLLSGFIKSPWLFFAPMFSDKFDPFFST